jgi:hypothetical protein
MVVVMAFGVAEARSPIAKSFAKQRLIEIGTPATQIG